MSALAIFDKWLARFMLAVDEVIPLGWLNLTSDERRYWMRRAQ